MTLKTIDDPVPWVRAHPERFFKTGKPNDLELAHGVWLDATLSGCRDAIVHHDGPIWAIEGSRNWLTEKTLSAPDLFIRGVPLGPEGPNSMRSEIVLNAFCTEVLSSWGAPWSSTRRLARYGQCSKTFFDGGQGSKPGSLFDFEPARHGCVR
jgi:hypothetical protein